MKNNFKLVDQWVCCLLNHLKSGLSKLIVEVFLFTNTKKSVCVETRFDDARPPDVYNIR